MAFASSTCRRPWTKPYIHHSSTSLTTSQTVKTNNIQLGRRVVSISLITSLVLASTSNRTASAFEFRLTVPEQSTEEAEGVIREHVQGLLDVKYLLESEDWREAQREMRRNARYLKQDIYTIIQSKEGSIRPLLRKLYFDLFNNVTKVNLYNYF